MGVQQQVPEQEGTEDGVNSSSQVINVLGLQWNTATEQLSLMPKIIGTADRPLITKREVLKDASKLFDPFGIASPVSVRAKLFMQKLWQLHVEWDEPLDAAIREDFL